MAWARRLACVLAHPRFPWLAALIGMLLASSALGHGLLLDDHLHRLHVEACARGDAPAAWWDLYTVATGDTRATRAAMDIGASPWWTLPELRVRFFRPVAAATHHLDHRAWPHALWLMHAQSLAWYGALIVAVGALARRWLGVGWVAGLATLLFAIDDAHATPVAWIAQRNALISGLFTVLALVAHDRARREAWRPGSWLGPMAWVLALGAGEVAIAGLGYLGAHALLLDPASRSEPGRSLATRALAVVRAVAPYLVIVIVWRVLYDRMGYGAYGSGVYLDPVRESAAFLEVLPDRMAALALGQLAWPEAETWVSASMPWTSARWGAVSVILAITLALVPRLRRDRGLVVAMVGAGLALVPIASAIPNDRLLLMVGVGGSVVVASTVAAALGEGHANPRRGAMRVVAALVAIPLLVVHTVGAALAMPKAVAALPHELEGSQRATARGIPSDDVLAQQELVIVNSPPTFVAATLWLERGETQEPLPRRLRVLGSTFAPVIVQRPDPMTLILQPVGGYLGDPFTTIVRGPSHPLAPGDRISLDGFHVEILGVAHKRPTVVKIRFDVPLDDASLRWITWQEDRFVSFALPPVGGTTVSPGRAPTHPPS